MTESAGEEAKGNDVPEWVNPPILSAWMGDRGVGYSPKYQLFPRNKMPELTESQKKQYEEVREWLSIKVMEFATQMVSGNYKSSYQFSTEILSDSRIAILDEDQDMRISITSSSPPDQADDIFKIQKDFSDFKRVLPKGEVKP